jgi:predicted DNA-binding transcriptional regulator AlpA
MNTVFLLLAIYEKPRLSLEEVCRAIGISTGTGYQQRSRGVFPVPMIGSPLTANIRDVAEALGKLWEEANRLAGRVP